MSDQDFQELMYQNQGLIHKLTGIYTDTSEDRQDLFQEILFQLWKSRNTYKEKAKISTWMYQVGLFTAISYLKRRKREERTEDLESALYISENSEPDIVEENIKQLYINIRKLNKTERAVILLYLEEKSYREISEILGISESNVGVRINRIKKKIKDLWS